jgi:hypothetical protein
MKQSETNLGGKRGKREVNYNCNICDYKCSLKYSYERHILTTKHKKQANETNETENETKKEKKEEKEGKHENTCECGQIYYSRTSLWRHTKKCLKQNEQNDNVQMKITDDKLISILINQCKELRDENKELIDILKNGSHIVNNSNNNINSHNKMFNLQFFLNETCKDAMNIMDFVDSIKLQLSDLESVGKLGYVEGISNIIIKNLKELDITQRPVHCADKKREVMYVKDENKWEKEDEQKQKIKKAIKRIVCKNQRLIPEFKEKHPDCLKSASNFSDQYNKIIVESMGGSGDNDLEKEDKIIKNISKITVIDKT